jgi:hypothetical protein
MTKFIINNDLLEALDDYHNKSLLMQKHTLESIAFEGNLQEAVNDDLIYNVPIYDTAHRKFAAFSSFTEAVWRREQDPKGNGKYFASHGINDDFDWFMLFYLFRLCGSGINYVPRVRVQSIHDVLGTHGFGNFWVINSILRDRFTWQEWKEDLINLDKPFTDNKGYLLPQFSFEGQTSNHLKRFILEHSEDLVRQIYNKVTQERMDIYQVTDFGNVYLNSLGFKRQNFVLTAFAADLAEYFSTCVNPHGMVYAGTNAIRCIKAIFPKVSKKINEFEYINDVLAFQSTRYGLNPIDCEDSRNCDLIRYFQEYQSQDHIKKNGGNVMKNNSVLKEMWGYDRYYDFAKKLK